jgi:L-asparaginase
VRTITIISTGGTIEKTYDEFAGELTNKVSVLARMLRHLRLEDTTIETIELMHKDSLELTDADRQAVVDTVLAVAEPGHPAGADGVIILHGTDTLGTTGDLLHAQIPEPRIPIVLTGAMRPYEMKRSDALQNLNEAIFATRNADPGVYFAGHGKLLTFPGVVKDRERGTFVRLDQD